MTSLRIWIVEEQNSAGGSACAADAVDTHLHFRLRRFFADDQRFGLCVRFWLAAREDLDITEAGHTNSTME